MNSEKQIKIIETPRDGMQGLDTIIPTRKKIEYINLLLQCGFDTVEVGSFVSQKAIPQMADTAKVLEGLDYSKTRSKIAVLVSNLKFGERAAKFDVVDHIFFPFSTSPTFLRKNLHSTLEETMATLDGLQNLCVKTGKELVAFISLPFGDPYGDPWSIELVNDRVEKLVNKGIRKIPFADTIGDVDPQVVDEVYGGVVPNFPGIEFGLHAHAYPGRGKNKVASAWKHGVRRFDTVIGGLGGCPMTDRELVGNLSLEALIAWCESKNVETGLNMEMVEEARRYPLLSKQN